MAIERCFVCEKEYATDTIFMKYNGENVKTMKYFIYGILGQKKVITLNLCPQCNRTAMVLLLLADKLSADAFPKEAFLEEDTNDQT